MNFESEMKARFGGFWNSLVLLLVVIICLRFSAIEWASEDLGTKLYHSFKLFFWCALFGVLLAILKIIFSISNPPYLRLPASANFAWGLKRGITIGGFLILLVGILQLDNFMGVFQPFIDKLLQKLLGLI
ncbi:hypothetical protein [Nitrosomonas sp. Nm33]|uniref:hypothetical protein n=1 Tax=Nitrosomonas sp. Nm33 TaxID=133724 RepID=UPI00089D6872|nr:hypothetical protein [Nitrosomonas sp. Nm33]SDY45491.1 hypothetical protein SAMN05421755_102324 [Nitrosomonas sp. Nm33]